MAEMGAEVFSVEVVEEFAEAAETRFKALGYDVRVKVGDGSRGWPEHEPYDRIIVTAAATEAPQELTDELSPGGRMVIPLGGEDVQALSVVEKDDDGSIKVRRIMPVRFTRLETIG
jgi:protein-L-isoaspartate(D-aspartate) O-methyltransferase